jgi:hypothetical protein
VQRKQLKRDRQKHGFFVEIQQAVVSIRVFTDAQRIQPIWENVGKYLTLEGE